MKNHHRLIGFLLLLAGLAVFIVTIRVTGWRDLADLALRLGPGRMAVFLSLYLFMNAWDVAGWRILFPGEADRKIRFGGLYLVRLAGESLNNLTPFLDIGGEFLKVALTGRLFGVDKKVVLASVVVERSLLFFSEIFFWFFGMIYVLWTIPLDESVRVGFYAGIFGALVSCLLLYLWQRKGFFVSFLHKLRFIGLGRDFFEKTHTTFRDIDGQISAFYSQKSRGRMLVSFLLHFAGWAAGALEVAFLFWMFGRPIGLWEALCVESLLHLIRTMSFFIPGNIGAQEAGLALLTSWMGYDASLGVALSLCKRFRQIFWTAAGFAVWGYLQGRTGRSVSEEI